MEFSLIVMVTNEFIKKMLSFNCWLKQELKGNSEIQRTLEFWKTEVRFSDLVQWFSLTFRRCKHTKYYFLVLHHVTRREPMNEEKCQTALWLAGSGCVISRVIVGFLEARISCQKNTNKEGYSYARWFDVDVVTFILVL